MRAAVLRLVARDVVRGGRRRRGGLLDRAGAAVEKGQHAQAIDALEGALAAVREAAPLTIESFMLVGREAKQFGDFAPRTNTKFAADEPILFYMEPKNLVYGRLGAQYVPSFEVDLEIIDASGESVASKEAFGSFRLPSMSPVQDLFLNLSVSLTGAPPGDYIIRLTVRDLNSTKKASVEQKVTMASGL